MSKKYLSLFLSYITFTIVCVGTCTLYIYHCTFTIVHLPYSTCNENHYFQSYIYLMPTEQYLVNSGRDAVSSITNRSYMYL